MGACLESALAQTLTDLEVLVLDDASTDDTVSIAQGFADRDPRVSVQVNPQRLGLARNWNRAIDSARGEWIKFLFQDDLLAPTCLEQMTAMTGAKLVLCDRTLVVSDGSSADIESYIAGLPKMDALFGENDCVSSEQVCAALVEHPGVNFFGEPSAVLLHRSALAQFGSFNTQLIQICDLEYWARVASQAGFSRVREELATFRIHEQSASAANLDSRQFQKDVLDTLILYHEFAFDSQFAKLRRTSGGHFSALAARELQRAKRDVAANPELPLGDALQRVLAAHPKLKSPLWRLWHKVRKQLPSQE